MRTLQGWAEAKGFKVDHHVWAYGWKTEEQGAGIHPGGSDFREIRWIELKGFGEVIPLAEGEYVMAVPGIILSGDNPEPSLLYEQRFETCVIVNESEALLLEEVVEKFYKALNSCFNTIKPLLEDQT